MCLFSDGHLSKYENSQERHDSKHYVLCTTESKVFQQQCRSAGTYSRSVFTATGNRRHIFTINGTCSAGQIINVTSIIIKSIVVWNIYVNSTRCPASGRSEESCLYLLKHAWMCNGLHNCSFNDSVTEHFCNYINSNKRVNKIIYTCINGKRKVYHVIIVVTIWF